MTWPSLNVPVVCKIVPFRIAEHLAVEHDRDKTTEPFNSTELLKLSTAMTVGS